MARCRQWQSQGGDRPLRFSLGTLVALAVGRKHRSQLARTHPWLSDSGGPHLDGWSAFNLDVGLTGLQVLQLASPRFKLLVDGHEGVVLGLGELRLFDLVRVNIADVASLRLR